METKKEPPSMTQAIARKAEKRAERIAAIEEVLTIQTQRLLVDLSMSLPANAVVTPLRAQKKVLVIVPATHALASMKLDTLAWKSVGGEVHFELALPLTSEARAGITSFLSPEAAPVEVDATPEAPAPVEAPKRRTRKTAKEGAR